MSKECVMAEMVLRTHEEVVCVRAETANFEQLH